MAISLDSSVVVTTEPAALRERPAITPVDGFLRVLRIGLALDTLLGLCLLLWPGGLAALLGLGQPTDPWARAAGLMVLGLAAFTLPALIRPLRHRFATMLSTAMRATLGLLFLCAGGGFLWLCLYETVLAVAQGVLYWRAWLADLMSKP